MRLTPPRVEELQLSMQDGTPTLSIREKRGSVNKKLMPSRLPSIQANEKQIRGTHLFVDSFDPFHVCDRVLSVMPVLGVAAPQSLDECL
jgi:hypothetical protein